MSKFDFASLLTLEQKYDLVKSRISQFAAEAYQATLNRQTIEAVDSNSPELEKIDESLNLLQAAIETHQKELDALLAE